MLDTVAACFKSSRPAFWECTVTKPTVRSAGLEPADHLVAATYNPAFACTIAVFLAETFRVCVGGAVQHGALCLLLSTAVCDAMLEPLSCICGAIIKLARSICTMLGAEATRSSKGGTAFCFAHFLVVVTAMPEAVSFFISGGCIAVV